MFRNTVLRFARERIGPHVRAMDDAGVFRSDLLREMFELGLMGIEIPEEYGGQGGDFFQAVLAVEALASVDPSAAVIVDVQNTIANNVIIRWGSDDQKRRYLPKLATDTVASFALSEAGSGSDAFALATRAEKRGDNYAITGRKLWITNAGEAGLYLVFANANPSAGHRGITCFLVERGFPGFQVGKKEDKLGIRASSTCELILDDCRVPAGNVLGEVGKGYKIAIETLNEGRIAIGAQMAGLAQGALDHAIAYAKQRQQFGKPIADFQGVQFELAQMATEVEAARLLVYNAARLRDGRPALRHRSRHGQVLRIASGRRHRLARRRNLRRRRLHQGLSGGKALSRCQNRPHLRRHHQYAKADHRQADARPEAALYVRYKR